MAFPLHPEFRTMPMVWYCPPLSPIMSYFEGQNAGQNPDMIFPAIEEMRLPIEYLANLLTAGIRHLSNKAYKNGYDEKLYESKSDSTTV